MEQGGYMCQKCLQGILGQWEEGRNLAATEGDTGCKLTAVEVVHLLFVCMCVRVCVRV